MYNGLTVDQLGQIQHEAEQKAFATNPSTYAVAYCTKANEAGLEAVAKALLDKGRHPKGCAAVFVHNGHGEILIGNRVYHNTVPGTPELCIPGGKIDWMEKAVDAAKREVREETGLEVEIEREIGSSDDFWPHLDIHCLTVHYVARVTGGTLTVMEPTKCDKWEWRKPHTLDKLFTGCERYLPYLALPASDSMRASV